MAAAFFMNTSQKTTTIIAPATPKGNGALALIRISGDAAFEVINKIFKPVSKKTGGLRPKLAHLGSIINIDGTIIDQVMLTTFAKPKSYTGEDMAEISCHGSTLITGMIIDAAIATGAVPASPGEFTFRAFINGKMDLVQTEAVAALIAADTEKAHNAALQQLDGRLSEQFQYVRKKIIAMLALTETQIDFSEEELPPLNRDEMALSIRTTLDEINNILSTYRHGRIIREGFRVTLLGPPNAGKSSLFNALCNSERVIVDEHPGTTRDSIEETISIDGYRITIIDTAGIRETKEKIETIGIKRAIDAALSSDLVLNVVDCSETCNNTEHSNFMNSCSIPLIKVYNKIDKGISLQPDSNSVTVSALTGAGINELKKLIVNHIQANDNRESAIMTSARQHVSLTKCATALDELMKLINVSGEEIIAQYLRIALNSISEITGAVTDDDILNHIFSNFCIGK
jgi:tRNA modification GTPase